MGQLRHERRQDRPTGGTSREGARWLPPGMPPMLCVECGGTIADVLARLGSTRCHDCRDINPAPSALVGRAQ
jgi:hypothetical protein